MIVTHNSANDISHSEKWPVATIAPINRLQLSLSAIQLDSIRLMV